MKKTIKISRRGRLRMAASVVYGDIMACAYDVDTAVEDCKRKLKIKLAYDELYHNVHGKEVRHA